MKTKIANTWIATLSAAAIAVGYVFLLFLPNQRAMKELTGQLRAKQDYVASAGSVAAALAMDQDELDRTLAYNAKWSTSAPPETELASVLGKLNALAVASGAMPTRFDPEPTERMEKLGRAPVVVSCTGTFAQIAHFLCDLEGLSQTVWIDHLQIESFEKAGEDVQCGFDVTIFTDNPNKSDQVDLAG